MPPRMGLSVRKALHALIQRTGSAACEGCHLVICAP
jgi:hypothetical protein